MSETATFRGTIKIIGMVHGALNTIVWLNKAPADWVFKQFVSQEELERFAQEEQLIIQHGDQT